MKTVLRIVVVCTSLLCLIALILIVVSIRRPIEFQSKYKDGYVNVAIKRGSFCIDNSPQVRIDAGRATAERKRHEQRVDDVLRRLAAEQERQAEEMRSNKYRGPDLDRREVEWQAEQDKLVDEAKSLRNVYDALPKTNRSAVTLFEINPAPLVLIAALPLMLFLATSVLVVARGRKLSTGGSCASCGYDLRGSPGRCPECGASATRA